MSNAQNQIILEGLENDFSAALEFGDWIAANEILKQVYDLGFHKEYVQLAEAKNVAMQKELTGFEEDPKNAPSEIRHA